MAEIEQQAVMDAAPQEDDDNEPMVHITPADNAIWAPKERDKLRSEGKEAILMSELPSLVPRNEGESDGDYAKRFSDYMNDAIRRGVSILGDQITHNAAPNGYTIDDHEFDVGPHSGITKGEYREFGEFMATEGAGYANMPERFKKFEVPKGTKVTY